MRVKLAMCAALCTIAAAVILTACGGGGGGGGAVCHSIASDNPKVTSSTGTCVTCSISNVPAAADGDFGSFATMKVVGSATTSIRATAQAGVAFPAGQTVGVYWSDHSASTYSLTLNTYLGGTLQESFPLCVVCGDNGPTAPRYDSARTTQSFDAVEVVLNGSQTNAQTAEFQINEICDN